MLERTTIRLLIGTAALLGIVCANPAVAALINDPLSDPNPAEILLKALAEELLASVEVCPASGVAAPSPSEPAPEQEGPSIVRPAEGLIPAGAAASNVNSQSNGAPPGQALTGAAPYLPEIDAYGSVPAQPKPILPTGPPFKLLRPT